MADSTIQELRLEITGSSKSAKAAIQEMINSLDRLGQKGDSTAAKLGKKLNNAFTSNDLRSKAGLKKVIPPVRASRNYLAGNYSNKGSAYLTSIKSSDLFKTPKLTNKASKTYYADMLRDEEKASKIAEANAKKVARDQEKARKEAEKAAKQEQKLQEKLDKEKQKKAVKNFEKIKNISSKVGKFITKPVSEAFEKVDKFGKKFKGIALYRAVRGLLKLITSGFQEGINNLYQYSRILGTDFKKSMDSLSTSATYMKNSVAAMIAPIINILAPIVEKIANDFAELANKVGLFIAQITNQASYSKAIRSMKEYNKASRQLLGFDEINKLNGTEDVSKMFEEVSTAIESGSIAESIKNSIIGGTSDGIGVLTGNTINTIIESLDVSTIGTKIGTKLQKAFAIALDTLKTINFEAIGNKVGTFFVSIIDAINWSNLGATVVERFAALIDFAFGFIESGALNRGISAIANFVTGAFETLVQKMKEMKWVEFGSKIGEKIGEAITGIDWSSLASSMVSFLFNAALSAIALVGGMIKGLVKSVLDTITQNAYDTYKENLNNTTDEYIVGDDGIAVLNPNYGKTAQQNAEDRKTLLQLKKTMSVRGFASGGFVPKGDLFIANEAGPELVGTIGNRTAVTNQDQFVSAVAGAMAPVIEAIYSTGNANVNAINNQPVPSIRIGDREIYKASQRGARTIGGNLVQGV